jgi:nitrogen PTS system EIIA component
MKLADFLVQEAIITDLLATTKEEAIREIVRSLQDAGYVADVDIDTLTKSFLRREELGTTAIGDPGPLRLPLGSREIYSCRQD